MDGESSEIIWSAEETPYSGNLKPLLGFTISEGCNNVGGFVRLSSRTWYADLFAKPRGRYQPLGANSRVVKRVGYCHSLPSLRRGTVAATTSVWPDNRIHGPIGCGTELVFSSSNSMQPKKARPEEMVGLFGEDCELLEYAPDFCSYSAVCQYFQEKVRESF